MPQSSRTLRAYRSPASREDSAFAWMARVGYAARGFVFILIAIFAALAALGSGRTVGTAGALRRLLAEPMGDVLLWLIAAGLLCFSGWRLIQVLFDPDELGNDMHGLSQRAAFLGSAVFYVFAAGLAVSVIFGGPSDDEKVARDWTAWLLAQPFGQWITVALGIAIAIAGLLQAAKPVRADFRAHLAERAGPRGWMIVVAWVGYLGRAVIFIMIGAFLVTAALHFNSGEAAGLGGALRALQHQPYGSALLGFAALGLCAFGMLQLMQAAWRPIDAPKVKDVAA